MLGLTVSEFEGFAPEDFDAFREQKWRSNRFNLERMRVRDKLKLLGDRLVAVEPALSGGLTSEVSGYTPSIFNNHQVDSLWLCFRRPDDEHRDILAALEQVRPLSESVRDPQPLHKEVLLGVRVAEDGLDVALRLHAHAWVDAQNLLARIGQPDGRAEWSSLLGTLAGIDGIEVRVADHTVAPGGPFDDEAVGALAALVHADDGWLLARRFFPRDDERVAAPGVVELITGVLAALLPVRRFVAWSHDNDRLDLAGRLAERRAEATRRAVEASAVQAAPEAEDDTAPPEPLLALGRQVPPPAEPSSVPVPEPIRDEDRRPEWARFTPRRPQRPSRDDGPPGERSSAPRRAAPEPRAERPAGPHDPPQPREARGPRPDDRRATSDPRPDPRPDSRPDPRPDPRPDSRPDSRPAPRPAPRPGSRPEAPAGQRPQRQDDRAQYRGDRPDRQPPPAGDRPAGNRPAGDRPAGDRPAGDRPAGDRPARDDRRNDRPGGRPDGRRDDRGDGRRDGRRDDRRDGRRDDRRDGRGGGSSRAYTVGPDEPRRAPKPAELKPSDAPVEARCTARVLDGLFRGQIGTVIDIDGKGNAQVLIHKRTVRVPSEQLQRLE